MFKQIVKLGHQLDVDYDDDEGSLLNDDVDKQ